MLLCGCEPQTVNLVTPRIPSELLEPVPVPDRQTDTLRDIGLLIVDYDEALGEANSKIEATAEIMRRFSEKVEGLE